MRRVGGDQVSELRAVTDEERRAANAMRSAAYRRRKKARELLGQNLTSVPEEGTPDHDHGGKIGNKLHLKHGARDPEQVSPLARQIVEDLFALNACPDYLRDESYSHAVYAWAYAEAQCQLMRAWADVQGLSRTMTELMASEETETGIGQGSVHRTARTKRQLALIQQLHTCETRAMNLRKAIGLDPRSRFELVKDVQTAKFDLAKFWEEEEKKDKERGAVNGGRPAIGKQAG
jgi:hypothetical protein